MEISQLLNKTNGTATVKKTRGKIKVISKPLVTNTSSTNNFLIGASFSNYSHLINFILQGFRKILFFRKKY